MTFKKQLHKWLHSSDSTWQPHDRWAAIQAAIGHPTSRPISISKPRRKQPYIKLVIGALATAACLGGVIGGALWNTCQNNQQEISSITIQDEIIINEVTYIVSTDHRPISSNVSYIKILNITDLISYLNYDIRPTVVPSDLQYRNDVFEKKPPTVGYTANGDIVELRNSNFQFIYTGNKPTPRQISIFYSKTATAVGEMHYHPVDANEPYYESQINGTAVKIGHVSTSMYFEGHTDKWPTERYVAEFTVADIHLQVTADNLTLDEFLSVIKSIIR